LAKGVVESKVRRTGESGELALDSLVAGVQSLIAAEYAVVNQMLKPEVL
jgi:hypothetical protein